jgi:DNA-binding transcriptional LysR family regulator
MELRQLRFFVVLAEELNFHRAAERLHVSQPPLSQHIRALENELGAQLFLRTTRKVILTEPGRAFLEQARKILADVDTAVRLTQRVEEGQAGRLTLGFIHSTAYTLLPLVLQRSRQTLPEVEVRLRELTVDHQIDALLERKIDLGIVRMPVSNPGVEAQIVRHEHLVVAVPAGSPLLSMKRIPVRRLATELMIGYPSEGGEGTLHVVVSDLCRRAGFVPRFTRIAGTMHTTLGLVRAGEGIAIVPSSTQVLSLQGVEYRPLAGTTAQAALGLAVRTGEQSALVKAFSSLVLKAAATMGAR